jgi:HTH-type transcriptional repressor of NAD biosynthesis genes
MVAGVADGVTRGFLLGKFMPPHAGHVLMCETAAAQVTELTILVCWLPDDPIPGPLRLQWMRELFPNARVIGHDAVVPQTPEEHPEFWPIWRGIVKAAHPEPIDRVFASEPYGERLAAEVAAVFHPIDPGRLGMPVSGEAVRADPWGHWDSLPAPVKPYFARTICLHGPESTGKSTLAAALARHYATLFVPEYGRTWCDWHGSDCRMEDLLAIARTHDAMTRSMLRWCNRRLFLDTDPLMTAVWAEMMLGRRDPWFDSWSGTADLYLLLDIDAAWIDDGTRLFGDPKARARFMALCREVLEQRGVRWTMISGPPESRLEQAIAIIDGQAG